MLRPGKFRPFETATVWSIGFLLFAAGIVGAVLALERADLRLAFASAGVFAMTIVYLRAAKRGKPL
jgi:hypothetical protein